MIKRIYELMNKTYLTEKCNLLTLKQLMYHVSDHLSHTSQEIM